MPLTALEFLNIIRPEHDRISCQNNDEHPINGFGTAGDDWHGRCVRCMYLEIIAGIELPHSFNLKEMP